jgi:hypothetical protein
MKGLIINNTSVQRLSGPVSITILKPNDNFHERFKAPLIVLFGDLHFSNANQCHCRQEHCYKIYEPAFLQLWDSLDCPIDFYVEAFLHNEPTFPNFVTNREPLSLLLRNIHPCYKRNDKSKCITKNIHWHSADIRKASHKSYYNLERFIDDFSVVIEEFAKRDTYSVLMVKRIISKHLLKNYSKQTCIEYLELCKHGLRNPNFVIKFIENEHSLIMKQVKKTYEIWKQWIKQYMMFHIQANISNLSPNSTIDVDIPTIISNYLVSGDDQYIEKLIQYLYKHDRDLEDYESDFLEFNTMFLDMYMLTRTFKPRGDGKQATISLGYFGRDHSDEIIWFLTDVLKAYKIIYNIDNWKEGCTEDTIKRYIDFDKTINLDEIISDLIK